MCLKPPDFSQPKHLHCLCTGLRPIQASSALGFNEKMVIYSPGGSYFCLGYLRLKYVLKNCTVARQWVHHCAMSQTYHARAKPKVTITLVIIWCGACGTGLMGARHTNPLCIHKQERCVDECGCISLLPILILEADSLELSMWRKVPGPFSQSRFEKVIVSICSISSFSCSMTIVSLSKLSLNIFSLVKIYLLLFEL